MRSEVSIEPPDGYEQKGTNGRSISALVSSISGPARTKKTLPRARRVGEGVLWGPRVGPALAEKVRKLIFRLCPSVRGHRGPPCKKEEEEEDGIKWGGQGRAGGTMGGVGGKGRGRGGGPGVGRRGEWQNDDATPAVILSLFLFLLSSPHPSSSSRAPNYQKLKQCFVKARGSNFAT